MGAAGRNSATAVARGGVSFSPRFIFFWVALAACVGARTSRGQYLLVCVISLAENIIDDKDIASCVGLGWRIAGDYSHLQRIIDRCGRRALLIPGCSAVVQLTVQAAASSRLCSVQNSGGAQAFVRYFTRLQCKRW